MRLKIEYLEAIHYKKRAAILCDPSCSKMQIIHDIKGTRLMGILKAIRISNLKSKKEKSSLNAISEN